MTSEPSPPARLLARVEEPLALATALESSMPGVRADVGASRDGWVAADVEGLTHEQAAELAESIATGLGARVLIAQLPAMGRTLAFPGAPTRRMELAAEAVASIRKRMHDEMQENAAWLSRHARALDVGALPPGDLDREGERVLMGRALRTLRERAGDPSLLVARQELDVIRGRQRAAFHEGATAHRSILALPVLEPPPAGAAGPWFAEVERALDESSSEPPASLVSGPLDVVLRLGQ